MASIGDIFMRFLLEDSEFQAQARRSGTKAGNTAGAAMSKGVNKTLGQQLGQGFVQGLGLAGALGAANLAASTSAMVADLIGDSIEAASALEETVSKGRVIFGDSANEIEAWAETASTAFGQSKRAAIDAASGYAGLFATVGIAEDEAADKAQRLTELGSDLASFFNTDVNQALDAIKSGLSGESEPLRKFNVFLSETAVSAELARLGIKKVGGQFTEGQKATARYNLILAQTGAAQGDFARTADGLANTQRSLNAEIENLQAEIGEELLPIARDLSRWAADEGVPAISELVQIVKDAAPAFEALGFALLLVRGGIAGTNVAYELQKKQLREQAEAVEDASDALVEHRKSERESADATKATAAALGQTGAAAGTMGNQVAAGASTGIKALRNLRTEAIAAARGIVDRAYTNLDNKARLSAVNAEIAEKRRGVAVTSGSDAVTKGIDRQIEAQDRLAERTKRRDEADETIFQRTMRRLGAEYSAQLNALDLAEKQEAIADRRRSLNEQLNEAQLALVEAQGGTNADAISDAMRRVAELQREQAENEKDIARDTLRERLEGVRDYIAEVARLEASTENRPAFQKTLQKRETVLTGHLDKATAEGDADAIADVTARLEAVRTALERNAQAIRAGNRQKEIEGVKAGLERQREAVSSMVTSTKEDLSGLYAEQNQLVLDLIEAGVGGTQAVTDAIAMMKERLKTASTEESVAILATIALLEKLDSRANQTFGALRKLKGRLPDVVGAGTAGGAGTVGSGIGTTGAQLITTNIYLDGEVIARQVDRWQDGRRGR